jgi:RNA polymerase sigma factor (sigma-70 family)
MKAAHEDPESDFDLVQRWAGGDRAAGDRIIRRHFPALRRFFLARISEPDAREDLIQETLQGLTQAVEQFAMRSSFAAFMFAIARNKLYSHLRDRYRHGGNIDPLTESVEDIAGRSLSSYAALHESSQRMLAAMSALALDDQLLLELCYWHQLSGPELAAAFDISPDAVRGRLHRARKRLLKLLDSAPPTADAKFDIDGLEARLLALGTEV